MTENLNPEMLILAREVRGMTQTQLAKVSKISQSYLSLYETGDRAIPPYDIAILADILQFPHSFFFQEGRQYFSETGEYFHRKRSSTPIGTLNRIHAQLNIFRLNTERLIDRVRVDHPHDMPSYDVRAFGGDIEAIADAVRAAWNIPPGPIRHLVTRLEDAYTFIHVFDFETNQMDETTQWCEPTPPIMLMNSQAPGDRLRHSLAHALGHLVLHHGLQPYEEMEKEADRFAAAFLMPADEIRAELKPVTIEHLLQLKSVWRVSLQALIVRARDVSLINETRYKSLFQTLSRMGYRRNEPVIIPLEEPKLFGKLIDYHRNNKGRSIADLADMAHITEHDFRNWYLRGEPGLRILPKTDSSQSDQDSEDKLSRNN